MHTVHCDFTLKIDSISKCITIVQNIII